MGTCIYNDCPRFVGVKTRVRTGRPATILCKYNRSFGESPAELDTDRCPVKNPEKIK